MINTIDGRTITSEQARIEAEDYIKDEIRKTITEAMEYMEVSLEEAFIEYDNDEFKIMVSIK